MAVRKRSFDRDDLVRVSCQTEAIIMYKSYLSIRETWALPVALAALLSCLWLPAARADIFVSFGSGNPSSGQVSSFSEFTGAPKQIFTGGLVASQGVAVGPDGNLYVADGGTGSVLRFNPSTGNLIGTFVAPASPSSPLGITFGPDNNLYMADAIGVIRQFNGSTGDPMVTFSCAVPFEETCSPFDLTFGSDNNLYISDLYTGAVLKFSGSTFEFLNEFVPAMDAPFDLPLGLQFGPNGNLYVVWEDLTFDDNGITTYYKYPFLEFNGGSGAPIALAIPEPNISTADFAFGPLQYAYVATSVFGLYGFDPSDSYPNGVDLGHQAGLVNAGQGFMAIGGPFGIWPYLIYDPVDATPTQTLKLSGLNPALPGGPGAPVQALLGFQNSEGAMVGPTQLVSLNPGQSASLSLEASTLISSGRIQLQPVVTSPPSTALGVSPGPAQGSLEVYTTSNGVGSVLYQGIPVPTGQSIAGPLSFPPQGVILGQSMQINVMAPPDSPCVALLSFANVSGTAVGPTKQVNLSPGTMTSLVFNPNSLTKSGREDFIAQITPNNPTGGAGVAPACLGSVEVFLQKSGDISTYQVSSPAVGTAAAVVP